MCAIRRNPYFISDAFSQTKTFTSELVFIGSKHIKYGELIFPLTGENKPDIAKAIAYSGHGEFAVVGDLAIWSNHSCDPK